MNVTLDEAILIFAKATYARYGIKAVVMAKERADQLQRSGDMEGVRVWNQVETLIVEIRKTEANCQDHTAT